MKAVFIIFLIPFFLFSITKVYISPQVAYRDYHEELQGMAKSDEYGVLYGYRLGLENHSNYLYGNLFTSGLFGKTTYNGTIYSFADRSYEPVTSKTGNRIYNLEASFGPLFQFCILKPFRLIPLVGYGYYVWHRDSEKNDSSDYDIKYSWGYYLVGIQSDFLINKNSQIGYRASAKKTVRAESKLYLDQDIHLDLANMWQYSIDLFTSFFYQKFDLSFIGFFQNQPIGASEIAKIDFYTVQEPPSKTSLFGIRIQFDFRF